MTHLEYLRQLIVNDGRNILQIAARPEVSVSGSSEPDAVAREWVLCEGFAIVRPGLPIAAISTWRQRDKEIIQFDTGQVEVIRLSASSLRLSVFFLPLDSRTRQLGPAHEVIGSLSQRSGRHLITRPLRPTRQGDPGDLERLARGPQALIQR